MIGLIRINVFTNQDFKQLKRLLIVENALFRDFSFRYAVFKPREELGDIGS